MKQPKPNTPQLAADQYWRIDGYLVGRHLNQCPRKFHEFKTEFIGRSNGSYHFIGDGRFVLVCSIQIKSVT